MARQTNQQQPDQATPEQALVTPATRPEVLLAIQNQQAQDKIHEECARLREINATLSTRLDDTKAIVEQHTKTLRSHDKAYYMFLGAFILLTVIGGGLTWLFASKVSALLKMAEEHQIDERRAMQPTAIMPTISERPKLKR